jgi:enoyl-CoA hydratase/carnithine racemase
MTDDNVLRVEDLNGARAGIRVLTLNRPERRNALSPALTDALRRAIIDAEHDSGVRVVVLTGAGDVSSSKSAFCAGGDLGGGMQGDGFFAQHKERAGFAELLLAMRRLSKPLVGAINGMALGGGFGLVLACDLAVAADDADLGTPEVKRGLFPMMIAALIDEQLPRKAAMELVLLGESVRGARAVELGIVNRVVPRVDVHEAAFAMAERLAQLSGSVLALGKRAITAQREMPFEAKLAHLASQLTLNLQLDDAAEGIGAFLEKRAPTWSHK